MYFIEINSKKEGPFNFEQVLEQGIRRNTLVWKQGLSNWVKADELPEFNEIFSKTPRELPPKHKTEIAKSVKRFLNSLFIGIVLASLSTIIHFGFEYSKYSNRNQELEDLGMFEQIEPERRANMGFGPLDKYDQGLTPYLDRKYLRETNFSGKMKNTLPKTFMLALIISFSLLYLIKGANYVQKHALKPF